MNSLEFLAYRFNYWLEDKLDTYDRQQKSKQKYTRPTHDLMCECRKCLPSINTYCRNIMSS